jgi:Uma2 family endonuclease
MMRLIGCPDFVIELLSQSDRLPKVQAKMRDWIANGAALGWLIDLYKRLVMTYSPGIQSWPFYEL